MTPPRVRHDVARLLDGLYRLSGAAAAGFLVAIAVVVLLQVGFNLVDAVVGGLTGTPIGLVVPSYAEFAGFFLAAASFLALAYSLRCDAHIRVSMLLQRVSAPVRLGLEVWCAGAGAALSGYFTVHAALLTAESWHYGDLSPGIVPVSLWLPQAAMTMGLAVLTLALAHTLVDVLAGRDPYTRPDSGSDTGPGPVSESREEG